MNAKTAAKEKEREQKLKAMRKDLEEKLEEQLPPEMLDQKIRVEVEKVDVNAPLEPSQAKSVIEALLFASSKPMTVSEIRKVMRAVMPKEIEGYIQELKQEYTDTKKSFEIVEIAGGYELATRKEFAPWICRVEMQKKVRQATQSALETLAIMAYKQPLTRAEIEELRGVDCSGVVTNLTERGFIKITGKKEIPGRPFLYSTTEKFLEHFGLNSLADLPSIDEIKVMVEQSVKKEDLLGTQKIVEVPQEGAPAEGAPSEQDLESAEAAVDAGVETPAPAEPVDTRKELMDNLSEISAEIDNIPDIRIETREEKNEPGKN
ncbi:MAG TPA: SMC-Scp complex subunit ScpB [Verrucomicrobiae bacterium]|nr:SMC-Scp complex subunit ScpB [Verrucomicrobiae bacterium]